MADFNPKTIKGNIGGVYFTKTKEAVDPFNLTKYNPNTNQNIILFHLEDGVENNIVTVNFAPNDSSMPRKGWTSHDFPAIFRGYVDHTVNGEAIPRTFAQYLALVPTLITDLNLNNKKPLSFNATVIQQSGVNLLGSFNTLNDLINAHTPTESLHDNDAIAYVYENGQNGYYKVYFSSASNTWYWGVYQGAISTSLSEVQYNLTGLQVQGGFRNPAPIVPLQDEQYRIIWQHLNELYAQYSVIEGELGELEQEIIELNTAVVKTISKTDTNTIIIGLTRIDNDVNIHAVVNVSSNSYNLLKVVGSDGLEVNPEDIINEIVFEINNTNSALRQAIDDIVDNKITAHNTNSEAHQDIRDDIETAEQNANEYTDEEVIRVEQKVDTHIENLNNPHGVTAEQVDTYTKLAIDNKDANTLQEAKDYTYSKVEIDNKDTAIMNKANNLENANMFKDVNYNNINGVLTFTKYDNTTKEIDLPLELLVESGYYDEVTNELVLVLANSSEIRIPVGNLLTDLDAHNIRFNGSGTNYLTTKTEVESAVKELDTRVKANADDKVDKVTGKALSTNDYTNTDKQSVEKIPTIEQDILDLESNKVDKVSGKGLSTNDYTTAEKNKLAGIASGAEVNVQSDWNATSGDALILNKPYIPTKVSDLTNDTGYITGYTETDPIFTAWDKSTGISITKSQVSDFAHNHDDRYYTEAEINTLLNAKLNSSLKGSANGLAELGADGKVPSSQLPSYVDDVLEYTSFSNFPTTGESSKIYISQDTNKTYRWGGSGYIEISASLALGETSSTAGRGDWTKTAHDHTLLTNNPHGVTKAQVGLGNVDNTSDLNKPISTATQSALNNKVDKNENITAGTHPKITYDSKGLVTAGADLVEADIPALSTSKITQTASARFVTDTEKTTWNNKVDKVSGKGLSTNDFTNNDKNKLDGIEAGAEVNTVDSVNGQTGVVVLDAEDVGALPDDTPLFSGDYDDLSNKPTIDQLLGNLSTLGFVKRTGTNNYVIDTSNYQPLDADLSSIAGLSGTSGLLRKTASNTWQLDTSVYLTEITKLMVEAVLTGTITTHTHNASAIVEDASHRFVTDTEKNTWDAKQNALGFTPENAANKKTTLSDSDVEYPTSKAVKTAIETAVSQTLKPMGNWNANTNTPTLTDSNINRANEMYYVSVAGTQFGIEFDVGDELVYNTNGVIFRRDNVDAVVSVNTKQGVVVLNQDDIGDGATYKRVTTAEKNTWNNKVDKVAGKGLSTEDYTSAEKTKLSGIEAGAQVNAVTSVAGKTGAVVLAKADVGLGSVQNYAIASKTQAEAGTVNTVYMTPLRTKEAITAAMGDIESALDAILGV